MGRRPRRQGEGRLDLILSSGDADGVVRRRPQARVGRTGEGGRRPGRGSGRADLAGPRPREGMGALWAVRLADWACLAAKAQAERGGSFTFALFSFFLKKKNMVIFGLPKRIL